MNKLNFLLVLFGITSLFADHGKIVKINENMDIWCETFGRKEDPACLLIMGAGAPGTFWSVDFCEKVAQKGFYVIRYDNRDTGHSTSFDFKKNPYTLLDMAKDAMGLLDSLHIQKAHLVGISMGGPIAELLSVHDPKRIQSIALIATSPDFRPFNLSMAGLPPEEGSLSGPQPGIVELFTSPPPATKEEQLTLRMKTWKLMNGKAPLEEKMTGEEEQDGATAMNHLFAVKASESLIREVPPQVKVPTVIFLGTEDPIFGPDHGEAHARAIRGSKYYPVEGMGHILNSCYADFFIDRIVQNAKSNPKVAAQ